MPILEESNEPISIIIVGASGFGQEALLWLRDILIKHKFITIKGFLDDNPSALHDNITDIPILSTIQAYTIKMDDRFIVAIGDPVNRANIIRNLEKRGALFFTFIHPTACIASTAKVKSGCIIFPFCAVGNNAIINNHVVMTWYSSVSHNAQVASFSVFSPYSTVNGGAVLEEGVFLGTHAVVNPLVRIGEWSKVAAGSVVYRSVGARRLIMGNPAKSMPLIEIKKDKSK